MSKAFLDTTVFSDALLDPGAKGDKARSSLASHSPVLLPMYAIKEFKAGPLRAYVWLHNRAVSCASWGEAIAGIATVMRHRNLAATAIKAVADFESSMAVSVLARQPEPPDERELTELRRKEAVVWLQSTIFRAWRKRRRAPFVLVAPLPCYAEVELTLKATSELINTPMKCTLADCCLSSQFAASRAETEKLEAVCKAYAAKPEMAKRRKVLRGILRHPRRSLSENECRILGDAVFALQCPLDATVLTTNISDIGPLTSAVGKRSRVP